MALITGTLSDIQAGAIFAGHYDGDGHTITGAKSTGKVDERDKDDADSYGCATVRHFRLGGFGVG